MLIGEKFLELERRAGNLNQTFFPKKVWQRKTRKQEYINMNYLIGDFLIRLKNAAKAGLKEVEADNTKYIESVAKALKESGYLSEVQVKDGTIKAVFTMKSKRPILTDLKLVSAPGLRVYADIRSLEKRRGPSILLLSTPKGVISSKKAIKDRVGGEVIVEVW